MVGNQSKSRATILILAAACVSFLAPCNRHAWGGGDYFITPEANRLFDDFVVGDRAARHDAARLLRPNFPPEARKLITDGLRPSLDPIVNTLPQQIDETTILSGAMITEDTLLMMFSVLFEPGSLTKEQINEMQDSLQRYMTNEVCTSKPTALFVLAGNRYQRVYRYSNGEPLFTLNVAEADCLNRN